MTDQNRDFNASASHISTFHRPYGPLVHRDESTVGAGPDVVITPAADVGEELSASQAAAAYMAAVAPKKPDPAGAADPAPAADELPPEGDADPAEKPPIGEDGEPDPADKPLIARPKSWTEAEDAEWQSTPRALQEKIVARELERDTAIRRAQNDAAEKLKGLTAKEQQAEQVKQQYEAKLPALMQALHDTNNTAFSDIKSQADAELLAVVDPARWVQWQSHQQKMAAINHELQQAEQGKAAKHQSEWQAFRNKEDALAAEKIPDLADPAKADKLMKRAGEKLAELGFTNDELNSFISGKEKVSPLDHRFQQLLFDSLTLADIRAAKATAVAAVKTAPPVQRPGTTRPTGAAASDRIQALDSKLNNSGDIRDATALYLAQQSARRRAS